MCKTERVLDVTYPNSGAIQEHADHVEPIRLRVPSMAIDPNHGGSLQLFAFPPVNRLHRTAKVRPSPSLYLDEGYDAIPLDHQIDVTVPVPEATLDHAPPPPSEPPLSDSLSELAKRLPGR